MAIVMIKMIITIITMMTTIVEIVEVVAKILTKMLEDVLRWLVTNYGTKNGSC